MDQELQKFIDERISKEQFIDLIEKTSIVAWNERIKGRKIREWLTNFTGECLGNEDVEQKIALWLLLNFTFYSLDDVKELCKDIYHQFLRAELEIRAMGDGLDRNEIINNILENTCFMPLGNASESGAKILYDFRTVNGLGKDLFEVKHSKYECLVLMDDVTISGFQAIDYLSQYQINADRIYFLVLMATPEAIKNLEATQNIKLIYSILLDSRTKCFSDDSFVFQGKNEEQLKLVAKELCEYYGNKIMSIFSDTYMKDYPLGYHDDQQMLGFYYNTPDNTLPIFWCEENWKSIFPRYNKIYGNGKVDFNDEQYI